MIFPICIGGIVLPCLLAVLSQPRHARAGEAELQELMRRMETDALELAYEIERVYTKRCQATTLNECDGANYDGCLSEYPNQSCPGGPVFGIPKCGDGKTCGGIFDTTISTVRVPTTATGGVDDFGNPQDDLVKETVCYSRLAEPYMSTKFQEDKEYWKQFGVEPPTSFFGSDVAAFRIHPARHRATCGTYDTTRRPWYVAATSGPKDVILVLDVSGSMARENRMDLMKQAAARVVDTLTLGDHVAVVAFHSAAESILESRMVQATNANKKRILDAIDDLEPKRSTNFMDAFDKAFDILAESREFERSSLCSTAILFLTDGFMTVPQEATANDVIDLIRRRDATIQANPRIFLYSLGYEANNNRASQVPRQIACAMQGMWSKVEDGGDLAEAMSNYYKLFALGLGDNENEGFVAWVDVYTFATGGVNGTTVSAPVYDRSVTPHVLLGAVGIDFTIAAMDTALGVDAGSRETLDRLVRRSTAVCPQLNLTECEVQSLRRASGGDDSLCDGECTKFVGISAEPCSSSDQYPTNFWANTGNLGRRYEERVCCQVGKNRVMGQLNLKEIQCDECVAAATATSRSTDQCSDEKDISRNSVPASGSTPSASWSFFPFLLAMCSSLWFTHAFCLMG